MAERDGRRAPSATPTTSRRWWSTSPATRRQHVNGQVFHSYGYGYTLLAQPHAVRSIEADRRWDPEELAAHLPPDARRRT